MSRLPARTPLFHIPPAVSRCEPLRRYDREMVDEPNGPKSQHKILCNTCARYSLERFSIALVWQEGRRCVVGMRFAGERTECSYYTREPGSDDE